MARTVHSSIHLGFAIISALVMGAAVAQAAPLPDGSYKETCRNARAGSTTLTAFCRTRAGNFIGTRLEAYRDCFGDIFNENGRLMCRQTTGEVTLFQKSDYRGRSYPVTRDIPRLPDSFNDLTSSIRVSRGRWEVCTEALYRGRCEIIRSDVHDLDTMHLSNRISSLRRVSARYDGREEHESGSYGTPSGSYRDTCRRINFDGGILSAECRDRGGRYEHTELDLRGNCHRGDDIVNRDGDLTCESRDDRGHR